MKKNLLSLFLTAFLFTATSNLQAQQLYGDSTIDPSGEFISYGSPYILLDDVQLNAAALGAYDSINVTLVKVLVAVSPTTAASTASLYYSLVDAAAASPEPAAPTLLGTVSLPAGGNTGQSVLASFGDSVHTLFKVPKLIGNPYLGTQTFFVGLNFSQPINSNTGTGCGWVIVDPTEINADSMWVYSVKGKYEGTINLLSALQLNLNTSFYTQIYGTLINSLPVKFISFDGVLRDNEAVLNWSTASEINNKGFNVEKSADGKTFTDIGFVSGNGTTQKLSNYTFSDPKLLSGDNYYRLKQIDLDGKFTYSSVIKLEFNKFDWTIIGNPSNNSSVQVQLDKQHTVAVQIVSLAGNVIQTISKGTLGAGTYSIPLDFSHAASGMYVVRMIIDGQSSTKNIMK